MKYTMEEIRAKSIPIAQQYGIQRLGLFGSYARGDATDESDIDMIVDCGAIRSAFQMGGFYADLSDGLGKELDLITTDHRDKAFLGRIQRDQVRL